MSPFDWIPKWISPSEDTDNTEKIIFGRQYTAYTDAAHGALWKQALADFENGDFVRSVLHTIQYISGPDSGNHWAISDEGALSFTIIQGSKELDGIATAEGLKACAKVANAKKLPLGLLRKLLELNYQLNFSRYALDESHNICLRFDSYVHDGSPYKIVAALKEIALNADKQDDQIVEDYPDVHPVNIGHIIQLPEAEKNAKLRLIRRRVRECLDYLTDPLHNSGVHAGGLAYLLLDNIYCLDYLARPEGKTMAVFEDIQKDFFSGEARHTTDKIQQAKTLLTALDNRPDSDFLKEIYYVPRSFSVLENANLESIREMWRGEATHIDWYIENKHHRIAEAIAAYAMGYALFNYILPPAYLSLIHFYYKLREPQYFADLGFREKFLRETGPAKFSHAQKSLSELLHSLGIPKKMAREVNWSHDATIAQSYLNLLIAL